MRGRNRLPVTIALVLAVATPMLATARADEPAAANLSWAFDARWSTDAQPGQATHNGTAERSERWRRPLDQIPLQDTTDDGRYPPDLTAERAPSAGGGWRDRTAAERRPGRVLEWAASELDHQPLYFDDVPLERYGQSACPLLQPFFSAARFYGSLPVMPYKVGRDHPFQRVSTLGYFPLGTCAPCTHQTLPWDGAGALLEGGAWVGFIFLLP